MHLMADGANRRSPFDFAQGRLSTSLRSGRHDNSYLGTGCECQDELSSGKTPGAFGMTKEEVGAFL